MTTSQLRSDKTLLYDVKQFISKSVNYLNEKKKRDIHDEVKLTYQRMLDLISAPWYLNQKAHKFCELSGQVFRKHRVPERLGKGSGCACWCGPEYSGQATSRSGAGPPQT